MKVTTTFLFLSIILLPAVAFAGALEDAQTAYDRHDYQTTLNLLQPLANQGNAKAQFALGVMYEHGAGVKQDYAQAAKWYRTLFANTWGQSHSRNGFAKQSRIIAHP